MMHLKNLINLIQVTDFMNETFYDEAFKQLPDY